MRAIIQNKRGKDFSTMQLVEQPAETPNNGELKVRMITSRINPVDMDLMKGFPSLKYKKPQIGGIDGAGEVIEVGKGVSKFQVGDKVLFYRLFSDIGTWAEEITIKAKDCAKIPDNFGALEAGAIALPILTAYEAVISLQPQKGDKILVHGAGGGVGFQAVQICKALGLEVIANASKRDEDNLIAAGVSKIIDYKSQDFSEVLNESELDYIFDVIGKETLLKSIQLKPKKVVSISFPDTSKMHKAGVNLPGFFKFIMKMMNKKFVKAAKKENVILLGQVTGANGSNMQKAIDLISSNNYIKRELRIKKLDEISKEGLSKTDIGKVITF